jgi:hypothetical protein
MADFCSNDSHSPQPKLNSGQSFVATQECTRFLRSPLTIRQHNRAERLQGYFLLAIRKTFRNGSALEHGRVGSRQGRIRWIAASIYEPGLHSLDAAETDQWGGFPRASRGKICMSQRSHKLFINRYLSAERSILMTQDTASDPGSNGLNSLRRSLMKIGLVGRSRIAV